MNSESEGRQEAPKHLAQRVNEFAIPLLCRFNNIIQSVKVGELAKSLAYRAKCLPDIYNQDTRSEIKFSRG